MPKPDFKNPERLYIGGCIETETERIVSFPMFVRGWMEAGICQGA